MALQELRKEKAGLIVSDWKMPKMNGLELLKAVRSDQDLKDIPFIMITAEVEKENVLEAIKAGVSGYITKPFYEHLTKAANLKWSYRPAFSWTERFSFAVLPPPLYLKAI